MDDLFWIGLVVGAAWYLGYRTGLNIAAVRLTQLLIKDDPQIRRMVDRARDSLAELDRNPSDSEQLKVEQHGGLVYVYTQDTDEFLAQGESLQQALDIIARRFPNRKFQGHITADQAGKMNIKAD